MSEQRLYLDSLPLSSYQALDFPVFIKNKQSQYLWANDFFIKKSAGHQSLTEIYHKHDQVFPWRDYADELRSNDKLLFECEQNLSVCERVLRYDGTHVDIVSKKSLLFDNKKRVVGLIGFSLTLPKKPQQVLLTQREYTSVLLMSKGYTDKEIARKMEISPRTVESHLNNAKQKWQVTSRSELIVKFCQNNP